MSGHDGFLDAARRQTVQPFVDDSLFETIDTLLLMAEHNVDLQSDHEEYARARARLREWRDEHRSFAIPIDADRERQEPVVTRLQIDQLGPIAEIMQASGRLLREIEERQNLVARDWGAEAVSASEDRIEAAAVELRATFDKWLPGWDSDAAGLDLN